MPGPALHWRPRRRRTTTTPYSRALLVVVWLLIGGLVVFSFGPALIGLGLMIDVDAFRTFLPWSVQGAPPPDTMRIRADTIDFYLPGVGAIVDAAYQGTWQTWAPYEVGGAPLASLPNHAVLSPVSWPYWVMPLWLAPAFVALSELAVVLVGMVLFLGRYGVRRSVALLAGLIFFSCGFMVMWANWPHVKVAAFIPLLMWAVDRAVRERGARDVALVALVVASMLLGGFPAVTMYALTIAGVYALVTGARLGSWRTRLRAWSVSLAGVVLGVGLSALQLIPFVHGLGTMIQEDRTNRTGARPASNLISVLAPDAFGNESTIPYEGAGNLVESTAFLGAGALVLVACAFAIRLPRGRYVVPVLLGSMFVACVLLIWVGGWPLALLQQLPGYDINSIGRASSVFGFLGAALAAFGLERLLRRTSPGPGSASSVPGRDWVPARWVPWFVAAVGVALAAVFVPPAVAVARSADLSAVFGRALVPPVVLLVLALGGVLVTLRAPGRWRLAGPIVLVLVVGVQSIAFMHRMTPLSDRDNFYPVTPAHAYLQSHLGRDRYGGGANWGLAPTSDFYRLRTPVGHEFTAPDWKDLLDGISPKIQATRTYSRFSGDVRTATVGDQPLLDQLSVRYWAVPPGRVVGRLASGRPQGPATLRLPPGGAANCALPGGPLRGVAVRLRASLEPLDPPARIHLRVSQSGSVLTSERALSKSLQAGDGIRIGIPGEWLRRDQPVQATVRFTGPTEPVALAADSQGPVCSAIRPRRDDALTLVHADAGSAIYERHTALPRIRWARRSLVVTDPELRVEMLERSGRRNTVLLEDSDAPYAEGAPALIRVNRDDPETISAEVDADGTGYLVVADSIARPGWSVEVDGEPAELVAANHAFAAVAVPEGQHTVTFSYDAPGLKTGLLVSGVSLLIALGLLLWSLRPRRHTRTVSPSVLH